MTGVDEIGLEIVMQPPAARGSYTSAAVSMRVNVLVTNPLWDKCREGRAVYMTIKPCELPENLYRYLQKDFLKTLEDA